MKPCVWKSGRLGSLARSFSLLFIFAVIVCFFILPYYLLSYLLSVEEANSLAVAKKAWKFEQSPSYLSLGYSGVVLYSFWMLILYGQLFILITTDHRCFLSKKNLPGYLLTFLSFCPWFPFFSFHLLLWYDPRHTVIREHVECILWRSTFS